MYIEIYLRHFIQFFTKFYLSYEIFLKILSLRSLYTFNLSQD